MKPRAIVLDDDDGVRRMMSRQLKKRGFEAIEAATTAEFFDIWKPGTVDVIVADWELSHKRSEHGDQVLLQVRKRDWDVPFVLISGRLDQTRKKLPVLESLLESGSARFVTRGEGAVKRACDEAEELIERRDIALLKTILSLRPAALKGATIRTSAGETAVQSMLEALVSDPHRSHEAGRPVARARSGRITGNA